MLSTGKLIRLRRIELGVGVRELARRIDRSPALVVRIESDEPPPTLSEEVIVKIATELKLCSDDLLLRWGKVPSDVMPKTVEQVRAVRDLLASWGPQISLTKATDPRAKGGSHDS